MDLIYVFDSFIISVVLCWVTDQKTAQQVIDGYKLSCEDILVDVHPAVADEEELSRISSKCLPSAWRRLKFLSQQFRSGRTMCMVCRKTDLDVVRCVGCDLCLGWSHFSCQNLVDDISNDPNEPYFCISCRSKKSYYFLISYP